MRSPQRLALATGVAGGCRDPRRSAVISRILHSTRPRPVRSVPPHFIHSRFFEVPEGTLPIDDSPRRSIGYRDVTYVAFVACMHGEYARVCVRPPLTYY